MAKKNDDADNEETCEDQEETCEGEETCEEQEETCEADDEEEDDDEEKLSASAIRKMIARKIDAGIDKYKKDEEKARESRRKKRATTDTKETGELQTLLADEQDDHKETRAQVEKLQLKVKQLEVGEQLRKHVARKFPRLLADADDYILPRVQQLIDADTDDDEVQEIVRKEVRAYAARHKPRTKAREDDAGEEEEVDSVEHSRGTPSGSNRSRLPTQAPRIDTFGTTARRGKSNEFAFTSQSSSF